MKQPANPSSIGRRAFVQTLSAAGAGLALGPYDGAARELLVARPARTRYALVGTGIRSQAAAAGVQVPGFLAADFDRMIRETRPQVVIVTTVDATHDEYIVRALNLGCDVITEKP